MTVPSETVVRQAAALLLTYPDAGFFERLPLIRQAVAELKGRTGAPQLERFCDHAQSVPPLELGAHYVDTFDLKRRRTLHLTFYTDGDTRRRGHALSDIKQVYASRGWAPAAGELPDHLAVMLEFAARGDAELGVGLLNRFRPALELLSAALREHGTRYADVVDAVRSSLPPASRADLALARRLAASGPPAEDVGLSGYPTPGSPASGDRTMLGMPTLGARR